LTEIMTEWLIWRRTGSWWRWRQMLGGCYDNTVVTTILYLCVSIFYFIFWYIKFRVRGWCMYCFVRLYKNKANLGLWSCNWDLWTPRKSEPEVNKRF
jgi:hypothetical protein